MRTFVIAAILALAGCASYGPRVLDTATGQSAYAGPVAASSYHGRYQSGPIPGVRFSYYDAPVVAPPVYAPYPPLYENYAYTEIYTYPQFIYVPDHRYGHHGHHRHGHGRRHDGDGHGGDDGDRPVPRDDERPRFWDRDHARASEQPLGPDHRRRHRRFAQGFPRRDRVAPRPGIIREDPEPARRPVAGVGRGFGPRFRPQQPRTPVVPDRSRRSNQPPTPANVDNRFPQGTPRATPRAARPFPKPSPQVGAIGSRSKFKPKSVRTRSRLPRNEP